MVELYETSRELVKGPGTGLCELLRSDSTTTVAAMVVGDSTVSDSVSSEPLRLLGGVVVVARLEKADTCWPGILTVMCCNLKDLP